MQADSLCMYITVQEISLNISALLHISTKKMGAAQLVVDCHVILKLSEIVTIQNQYYLQSLVLSCIKNHYLKSIPFISVSKH